MKDVVVLVLRVVRVGAKTLWTSGSHATFSSGNIVIKTVQFNFYTTSPST
jgi:hypothetical protein